MIISYNRDIEEERQKKRQINVELDASKFKVRCLEEDIQKQILENDKLVK